MSPEDGQEKPGTFSEHGSYAGPSAKHEKDAEQLLKRAKKPSASAVSPPAEQQSTTPDSSPDASGSSSEK